MWTKPHISFHFFALHSTSGYNVSDMYFFLIFNWSNATILVASKRDMLAWIFWHDFARFMHQHQTNIENKHSKYKHLWCNKQQISLLKLIWFVLYWQTDGIAWSRFYCCCSDPFSWSPIFLPNRFYKVQPDIKIHFSHIISNQDRHRLCSLDSFPKRK